MSKTALLSYRFTDIIARTKCKEENNLKNPFFLYIINMFIPQYQFKIIIENEERTLRTKYIDPNIIYSV